MGVHGQWLNIGYTTRVLHTEVIYPPSHCTYIQPTWRGTSWDVGFICSPSVCVTAKMADASGECEFTEENDEISEEYSSCFFKKKKKIRNYIAVKTELKD